MKTSATVTMAAGAILVAVVLLTGDATRAPASAPPRLSDGYESADALIAELLRALEKDDADALRRLRATEAEYREIFLPGSVREGQSMRRYPGAVADFAWGNLDLKSRYNELALLQGYRGRHFTVLLSLVNEGVEGSGLRVEGQTGCDSSLSNPQLSTLIPHPLSRGTYQRQLPGGKTQDFDTAPNTLIVFEGANVRHRATPVGADERRVILSMTYCTDPGISRFKEFVRRMKDTAFFGLRALWD